MPVDNSALIRPFVPETFDGDQFLYTEMLDRSRPDGNNKNRLMKTFYHRSQAEFDEQMELIRKLCDMSSVRAYTRLGLRSFKKVAAAHMRLVVDAYTADNHIGVKSLYNKALGTSRPEEKLWILDVDYPVTTYVVDDLVAMLKVRGVYVQSIPSKNGIHLIVKPAWYVDKPDWNNAYVAGLPASERQIVIPPGLDIHKDNPTNLYIPDEAE